METRRFESERARVVVAGTQSYQDVLWRVAGGPTEGPEGRAHWHSEATLEAEPGNPHDPSAVRVTVAGEVVGYLPRELAGYVQPALLALAARGVQVVVPCYARGCFTWRGGERDGQRASIGLGLRFDPDDVVIEAGLGETGRRAA